MPPMIQITLHSRVALVLLFVLHVCVVTCNGWQSERCNQRRSFILNSLGIALLSANSLPEPANAKSYSANARNLERLNTGDMSAGSIYDNNPKSDSGKRRRAMTGCKSNIAREEVADDVLKIESLSEKDCNQMVLEGNSDFMLQALRNLDCPSCPYGISSTRQ